LSQEEQPHFLDPLVKRIAGIATSLGYNGGRLEWKWRRRKSEMAEAKLRREMLRRSAKGKHKMCPECRSLVGRNERKCPECGQSLAGVSAPGMGRAVANVLPGVSSAVSLIMLVNGLWFVLMMMSAIRAGSGGGIFGFDVEMMAQFGAGVSRPRMLTSGAMTGGEWWRFITPIFIHGGLIHFLFNSFLLLQLGKLAEEIFGTTRFWVFYLLCGISGSLASQLPRFVITVGASGAILGMVGLLMVYGYRSGGGLGHAMRALTMRLIIYTMILSFMGIDHLNHIGGFACGALIGALVPVRSSRVSVSPATWQVLAIAGVVLVLAAFYQVAAFGRAVT